MSKLDCDNPRSYPLLAKLLDAPGLLDFTDRPTLLESLRRAVSAALLLPPGEARQDLLGTLNGSVSDACRRREYFRDKQVLVEQLRTSYPCASEIHDAALSVQGVVQAIHESADKAYARIEQLGADVSRCGWPDFRQDLQRLTDIISQRMKSLERSAGVSVAPELVDDSPLEPLASYKDAYQ